MNEMITTEPNIRNLIYEIRGKKVILDSDIATLFGYSTKDLNRNVKNNIKRFPENYCFQLTNEEFENLRCKNVTSSYGGRRYNPYAFTEYGVTMLAGILKSDVAVHASIQIVNTFIEMRKYISEELIEQKYYKNMILKHDEDINKINNTLKNLQEKELKEKIYFDGQIYDAYSKILDIMSLAKKDLIIIDSYVDKSILDMIAKIKVDVLLITKNNTNLKSIDISKYNAQYNNLTIKYDNSFHDRFLILDKKKVYHLGASINYAGKRVFAINKLQDKEVINALINKVGGIM